MDERIEQLFAVASAVRAENAGTRLALQLDELMDELATYFEERETIACG